MALTPEEKEKVFKWLDGMDAVEKQKTLGSQQSFEKWLRTAAYSIYVKVKNYLSQLWVAVNSWFG